MKLPSDYKDPTERFFAYARERHAIYLRREVDPVVADNWTKDPILRKYRFTNVFRELDRTTQWFRKYVRDPLRNKPEVLLATVLFRMLNRTTTGEAIFCQRDLVTGESAFDGYLITGKPGVLKSAIKTYCGRGPYVTGAYIIAGPPGLPKLDGMLKVVDNFRKSSDWKLHAAVRVGTTLESMFDWLSQFPYLGQFHSYEIVTDLRHTALLDKASDIMTWANVGPGARRGLNRIHGRAREKSGRGGWGAPIREEQALEEMRELLTASRVAGNWPQPLDLRMAPTDIQAKRGNWPSWEMRDVEHTLCEFDKYSRVLNGEGTPRGRFR